MRFDTAGTTYENTATITDGVQIGAPGVHVVNAAGGRILGGVRFEVGDSSLTVRRTGFVESADGSWDQTLVFGSAGSDRVVNEGWISGRIALAGGNDVYISRDGAATQPIDLGEGGDLFRFEGVGSNFFFGAIGGSGYDRFVFANTYGQIDGKDVSGFEEFVIERAGTYRNFSGFERIVIDAPAETGQFDFVGSINPNVDLFTSGKRVAIYGSDFRSVSGTSGRDDFTLSHASVVRGDVRMLAGDDVMSISGQGNWPATGMVLGTVDAGEGFDLLFIWQSQGTFTRDMSNYRGFEEMRFNDEFVDTVTQAVLSNVRDVSTITVGRDDTLTLTTTQLPDAVVRSSERSTVILEAGSIIGRYAPQPGFDGDVWVTTPDPGRSVTFVNRGSVTGDVRFYIGNDIYDGSAGSVGGKILGHLGNDTLTGGTVRDWLDGGAGDDRLDGGGGNDVLLGGFGCDTMLGGAGNDIYEVDNSGDITWEVAGEGVADNVFAYVDFALPDHVDNLIMLYGFQRWGVGNGGDNIIMGNVASNVIEGGAGYDTLTGGAESDFFIVRPGWYVDVITDFVAGGGTEDAILFDSRLFTSFAQVMGNSAQVGNDTWIGDGLGNTVVLVGVAQSSLHPDDFGFI